MAFKLVITNQSQLTTPEDLDSEVRLALDEAIVIVFPDEPVATKLVNVYVARALNTIDVAGAVIVNVVKEAAFELLPTFIVPVPPDRVTAPSAAPAKNVMVLEVALVFVIRMVELAALSVMPVPVAILQTVPVPVIVSWVVPSVRALVLELLELNWRQETLKLPV